MRTTKEEDDQLVEQARTTLSWIWGRNEIPENFTYSDLLKLSAHLGESNKLWMNEYADRIFNMKYAEMNTEDRMEFDKLHPLAKEFAFLNTMCDLMKAVHFKLINLNTRQFSAWKDFAATQDALENVTSQSKKQKMRQKQQMKKITSGFKRAILYMKMQKKKQRNAN